MRHLPMLPHDRQLERRQDAEYIAMPRPENGQATHLSDYVRLLQKRKWWILASIAFCVSLAYGGWKLYPKTFKSTVIITIDSPKVAKDYVKGLGTEGRGFEDPATVGMQQVVGDRIELIVLHEHACVARARQLQRDQRVGA